MKALATFALVAGATLLPAFQAHAWLQFCNETSVSLKVAYKHWLPECLAGGTGWRSKGYWTIAPGQCKVVQGGTLQSDKLSRYYYYRAESADGRVWGDGTGTITWNRANTSFEDDSCILINCRLPDGRTCYTKLPASKIDIGKSDNHTVRLTD